MKGSLTSRSQFHRVYEEGRKAVGRHMVLFALVDVPDSANGVVASKKVGNAVLRNRAKRLLREALRSQSPRPHDPLWLVLVARRSLVQESLSPVEISRELQQLLAQVLPC